MTRYWIGMREAVWLLLSTSQLEPGGQTIMLDAREEISVVEMARRVCRLLAGETNPCEIVFGSPRPGERLREELISSSEQFVPGPRAGLLRVVDQHASQHLDKLSPMLERLAGLAQEGDATALREAAMAAARELQ
jgi:FlaA1/EpsC-like NDP-sugar epimerase